MNRGDREEQALRYGLTIEKHSPRKALGGFGTELLTATVMDPVSMAKEVLRGLGLSGSVLFSNSELLNTHVNRSERGKRCWRALLSQSLWKRV